MNFGDMLRDLMREKNVTVPELSQLTGINKNTLYSYLRRNTQRPDPAVLGLISEAFDIDVAYFLGGNSLNLRKTFDSALGPDTPTSRKLHEIGNQLTSSPLLHEIGEALAVSPQFTEMTQAMLRMSPEEQQKMVDVGKALFPDSFASSEDARKSIQQIEREQKKPKN